MNRINRIVFSVLFFVCFCLNSFATRTKDEPPASTPSSDDKTLIDGNTYGTRSLPITYFQPMIVAGTTAQYYRGDKTWQALNAAAVGLGTDAAPQFARLGVGMAADATRAFSATGNGYFSGVLCVGTSTPNTTGAASSLTVYSDLAVAKGAGASGTSVFRMFAGSSAPISPVIAMYRDTTLAYQLGLAYSSTNFGLYDGSGNPAWIYDKANTRLQVPALWSTGAVNGLTLAAAATGFSIAGGTTSKTLTVSGDATINQSVTTTSIPSFLALNLGATSKQNLNRMQIGNVSSHDYTYEALYVNDGTIDLDVAYAAAGKSSRHIGVATTGDYFYVGRDSSVRDLVISSTGSVGIGTTSPGAPLHVSGYSGQDGIMLSRSGTKTWALSSDGTGAYIRNVTDSVLSLFIKNAGGIQFYTYGAGTLVTDASGNITASSDIRLKNVDGDFTRGVADLIKISPKLYHWNAKSGLDQKNQYAGLIAQDVQDAIPEAVSSNSEGILSLQDRPIIAALINAVKELDQRAPKWSSTPSQLCEVTTRLLTTDCATTPAWVPAIPSAEFQSLHFQVRLLEAAVALLVVWNIALTFRRRK